DNVHTFSMTRLAYDNSIFDQTSDVRVRDHDFTAFTISSDLKPGPPLPLPPGVFASDTKLQQLADGFSNADGLTVDDDGNFYFTDAAMHRIYRWDAEAKRADLLTDKVNNPMAAGFAGNGTLLVVDSNRSVYAVDIKTGAITKIEPVTAPVLGTDLLLPVGLHDAMEKLRMQLEHRGMVYAPRSNMATTGMVDNQPRSWFYAPGTTIAIMAGGDWL